MGWQESYKVQQAEVQSGAPGEERLHARIYVEAIQLESILAEKDLKVPVNTT